MSLHGDIQGTHTCNKWQVDIVTSASDQGERCLYRGFSWALPMKSWMAYRDCFHVISVQHPLSFPKVVQQPKRSKKQSQYVTIIFLPLFLCILPYHCANTTPITTRLNHLNPITDRPHFFQVFGTRLDGLAVEPWRPRWF